MKKVLKASIIFLIGILCVFGIYQLLQQNEKIDTSLAASGGTNSSDIQLMARAINRRSQRRAI